MFSAERARHLQDLFLSESWKGRFKILSDTTGFNLRIYSEDGNPIFPTEEHYPMCRGLLSAPDLRSKCDTYCHNTVMEAFSKCHPIICECYAKIMSFAFPVEYMGEKAVILGQGSFPTYEDFGEFIKHLSLSKIEFFPVTGPLKFTTAEDARNACSLVDSSISQLLKNTQETITLKEKVDSLKEVLGMCGVASKEQPETLYKCMIANLFALLDIKYITIFSLDKKSGIYKSLYSLKNSDRAAETFSISEHDIIAQELLKGKQFVSSMEPYMAGRVDFLKDTKAFYFFPILVNQRLEGILGIFDNHLEESDITIINGFCTQTAIAIENQRLHRELYRKVDRFAIVSDMTKTITPILNHETLLQTILDKSAELLKAEQGSLMLLDHETEALLLKAKIGINNGITEKLRIQKGEEIAGKVAELGEPFLVEDVEKDPRIKQKNRLRYKTRSFVSVPITIEDRVIGVLNLSDKTTGEIFNKEDLELIQSFATQAAIIVERNVFYTQTEELRKLALTDPLTGLPNRRYLSNRIGEELLRSQRYGRPLSLLTVDIDRFKGLNDTFGHPIGDKALKAIAESILKCVRAVDIASRYGGDEFVIILPETNKTLAVSIAERLRSDAAEIKSLPGGLTLTISIGIASYPEDGKVSELLLENVDKALYLAKNRGGNRTEVFS